jgi:hypothetical protein
MHVPIEQVMANSQDWPDSAINWTVQEAEQFLGRNGMEDSGRWFTSLDPDRNYETGAETFYSLHPADSITAASYARLARIFAWKRS